MTRQIGPEIRNKWNRRNPEKAKAYRAAYYLKNRTEINRKAAQRRLDNKAFTKARDKLRYAANKEKFRDAERRSRYGLSTADYNAMLAAQGGKCASCGSSNCGRKNTDAFCIDHHHGTGRIRGLLCHSCNCAIGHADDSPSRLRQMAEYLDRDELKTLNGVR